jgi:hypothetical protein
MFPKRRASLSSRPTARSAIFVGCCLAGALAPAAAQATPEATVSLSLSNVDPVRVGDARQGQLIIRNIGADTDTGTINVSDITLVPSCGGASDSLGSCLAPDAVDQHVIAVGPSATATSGACTPAPGFVVGPVDDPDTGKVRFTPFPAGSSLGWSASGQTSCTITFNYTVAHRPVHDTDNARPGTQTNLVAYAKMSWTGAPLMRYEGVRVLAVTVDRDQPTLSARALPSSAVATGQSIYATGTLDEGSAPTGPLTFDLFKGEGCVGGTPVQAYSGVQMNGAGLGQTPSFVANDPGTYWWRATYGGDLDNAPVTSACSNGTKVSAPESVPPPPPPPPPPAPGDGSTGGTTPPGATTTPGTGGTGGTGQRAPAVVIKHVRLDAFALTRRTFARATKSTALAATAAYAKPKKKKKAAKKGTTIKYTLSSPASVKIILERVTRGRRAGGYANKCVKATKKLRKKKSCARYSKVSTLTRVHKTAGAKKVSFTGRAGRKVLAAGSYRMRAVASAGLGTDSAERRVTFKIVKR